MSEQIPEIYIPSKGRYGRQGQRTIDAIPRELHNRVTYVVPADEGAAYRKWLSSIGAEMVVVLCTNVVGIADTRQVVGEHAEANHRDKFVMMDDDLRFAVRESHESVKLVKASRDDVWHMLKMVNLALDEYAHVGVSTREGNNRLPAGVAPVLIDATRTLRVLAYQTGPFLAMEHGRVEVMEDFDVNLQLLRAGYRSCLLAYWSHDQRMTGDVGGCSTYRTHEVHDRSARRLAELHPGFVALRQKSNKTDRDGFGTRTEVTISWKKAAAAGGWRV